MTFTGGATLDPEPVVTLHVAAMPFDDWTQTIAKQLDAVPVFRSRTNSIEFVPRRDLSRVTFTTPPPEGDLGSFRFTNYNVGSAIRTLALDWKFDIVLPEGLSSKLFDADFKNMEWKEILEGILETSGSRGHVVVAPNGLVRIVP